MKKLFCFILFLFSIFWGLTASAKTLTGGVIYTVESAREEAFKNIDYSISMEPYKDLMIDSGFSPSKKQGHKPHIKKLGRYVTFFSDGSYGVKNKNDLTKIYYYTKNGELEEIEFDNLKGYPRLTRKYNKKGLLICVFFKVRNNESYVYDADKTFASHWIGRNCYDKNGNITGYRTSKRIKEYLNLIKRHAKKIRGY